MKRKVLVIGSGGRESALGWSISKSPDVSEVIYTPEKKFTHIRDIIKKKGVGLTVVGSETALSAGIVNFFNAQGNWNVFGPTEKMARIESDKFYSYDLMQRLGIPQARGIKCTSLSEIETAINRFEQPVLKYRWLAKGKGVRVYSSQDEARKDLKSFTNLFGNNILVSQRIFGQEFSLFGICDGRNVLPFEVAFQDHKRAYDRDLGPNTGGMGAYGPVPIAPRSVLNQIVENMVFPVVEKTGYKGFIYAGMMMTDQGPRVIEFNARFGDPEAQAAMMLLKDSLYEPLLLSLEERLNEARLDFKPGASCSVVLTSKGYPGKYTTGLPISGISEAEKIPGVMVFRGKIKTEKNRILTDSGRPLTVASYSSEGLREANRLAYLAAKKIKVPGGFHYRKDIGDKALQ